MDDDHDGAMANVDDGDELNLNMAPSSGAGGSKLQRDACPNDLTFVDQPFGLDLHPQRDLVAVGLVSGVVSVFNYALPGNTCVLDGLAKPVHQAAARCVKFDPTGRHLYSSGTDMSLVVTDVETGAIAFRNPRIHLKAVSALTAYAENMLATGDEDGAVKLWDARQQNREVATFDEHEDWVSSFAYNETTKMLVSVAADGVLVGVQTRQMKVAGTSYTLDDELLSVQWMKGGRDIVAGTQDGVVAIWTSGQWDDPSDRLVGHPNSIDAIVKIDEDTIVTGSSDGLLRLISILPNKLLGVVGEHSDYPVESVVLSHDRKYLVSASHDNKIKFWNIEYLFQEDDDDNEDDGDGTGMHGKPMDIDDPAPVGGAAAARAMDSDSSSDSLEDGDDEASGAGHGPAAKLAARKPASKKNRKASFFDGL